MQSRNADEEVMREIEREVVESTRDREANLLRALQACCAKLVDRWHDSQMKSVRSACEEGQMMAKEDFTTHLYNCLNNEHN